MEGEPVLKGSTKGYGALTLEDQDVKESEFKGVSYVPLFTTRFDNNLIHQHCLDMEFF